MKLRITSLALIPTDDFGMFRLEFTGDVIVTQKRIPDPHSLGALIWEPAKKRKRVHKRERGFRKLP
jgi:hypothetical protein